MGVPAKSDAAILERLRKWLTDEGVATQLDVEGGCLTFQLKLWDETLLDLDISKFGVYGEESVYLIMASSGSIHPDAWKQEHWVPVGGFGAYFFDRDGYIFFRHAFFAKSIQETEFKRMIDSIGIDLAANWREI